MHICKFQYGFGKKKEIFMYPALRLGFIGKRSLIAKDSKV